MSKWSDKASKYIVLVGVKGIFRKKTFQNICELFTSFVQVFQHWMSVYWDEDWSDPMRSSQFRKNLQFSLRGEKDTEILLSLMEMEGVLPPPVLHLFGADVITGLYICLYFSQVEITWQVYARKMKQRRLRELQADA